MIPDKNGTRMGSKRAAANLLEAALALVRREIAHEQHGPVGVPMPDEGVRDGPRGLDPLRTAPGALDQLQHRRDLCRGLFGQAERGLAHVLEILIERGR